MNDLNIPKETDFYKYYPEVEVGDDGGDILSVTIGRNGIVVFEIEGDTNNRIKYVFKNEGALLDLFKRLTEVATHFANQSSNTKANENEA